MPRVLTKAEVTDFRERLCEVAAHLFYARGPQGFTLRELATELGVSPMTPYRYFKDKDAILAALVDEAIAAFQQLPKAPPATDLPAAELLELIGTAFVHTATEQLDLLTILVSEHHALADDRRFAEPFSACSRDAAR